MMTGLNSVLRNLNNVVEDIEDDVKVGVKKAADHILEKAISITPIDTGTLRNSGNVNIINKYNYIDGIVGFSDPKALAVHEMPNNSNWSKPGTGNKFLEKTLRKETRKINRIIANEVDL